MPTKQDAIAYATHFGWTKADAERAFEGLSLSDADELTLLTAMVEFAGPNLYERQRLQGAQKGLVTKKTKHIQKIEREFSAQIDQFEAERHQERSLFVATISRLYQIAQRFGFQDPWIEVMVSQYAEYQSDKDAQSGQQRA